MNISKKEGRLESASRAEETSISMMPKEVTMRAHTEIRQCSTAGNVTAGFSGDPAQAISKGRSTALDSRTEKPKQGLYENLELVVSVQNVFNSIARSRLPRK